MKVEKMAFKQISSTIIIDAFRKYAKDNLLVNFLLDSRKEFVSLRLKQDEEIYKTFNWLRKNMLTVLNRIDDEISKSDYEKIMKYLNDFTADLRIDLGRVINDSLSKIIQTASNPYMQMFKYLSTEAKLTIVTNKMFKQAIDRSNREVISIISNKQFGARKLQSMKLSGRIWKSSLYARTGIQKVIKHGMANGLSARDIAKNLNKYMTPTAKNTILKKEIGKKFPSNPHYYALRVARSEAQHSYQESMYNAGKIMPSYEGIYWVLSNRHPEYDICDIWANEKKYGEKGFYPKGKEPSLAHPNCICTQIQKLSNNDDMIDRLISWQKNPKSDKKLEDWYKKYFKNER
jgi:hypothetical protein